MKRLIVGALLILFISNTSFSRKFVASGKSNSGLGDYKIEIADIPVRLNGKALKTYVISYQNSPMEVIVGIRKGKNCKNYIVLSDELSVQYVCNESYFGVEKLDSDLEKEGYKTEGEALNRSEYCCQKVIALGLRKEVDNAHMIAAFFPKLINDTETVYSSF